MEDNSCRVCTPGSENSKSYWNNVFDKEDLKNWHQTHPVEIMDYVSLLGSLSKATVLCAGVGDSPLIEVLSDYGCHRIIANDISEKALEQIRARTPEKKEIEYLADDLINPSSLLAFENEIDLWIDRATLHFFTKCEEKDRYFDLVHRSVSKGGHVVIGVHSKNNKEAVCCGLELQLWSEESLVNRMSEFELIKSDTVNFKEQNGLEREYIFTLFKRL